MKNKRLAGIHAARVLFKSNIACRASVAMSKSKTTKEEEKRDEQAYNKVSRTRTPAEEQEELRTMNDV